MNISCVRGNQILHACNTKTFYCCINTIVCCCEQNVELLLNKRTVPVSGVRIGWFCKLIACVCWDTPTHSYAGREVFVRRCSCAHLTQGALVEHFEWLDKSTFILTDYFSIRSYLRVFMCLVQSVLCLYVCWYSLSKLCVASSSAAGVCLFQTRSSLT